MLCTLCRATIVDSQSSVGSVGTNLALWPDRISRAGAGRRLLLCLMAVSWSARSAAASQTAAFLGSCDGYANSVPLFAYG